ncbi:MAG: DUF1385 domain-containing protein [Clostridia bacterium]|nr:DUF1385 domain-containing protein [Clostridia bacterium]
MAKKEHKTSIGGSAVMEGVMMRGPEAVAVAVRKPDGEITLDVKKTKSVKKRNWILKLPIIRGCIGFFESMVLSTKALMFSAEFVDVEEEEPSKFDKWLEDKLGDKLKDVVIYFSVILSLVLSVGMFILLPTWLISIVRTFITDNHVILTVAEGVLRIAIFLGYLALVSLMPDIKRVFQYHGAEHKTIACYEAGEELTIENAKTKCRLHPRCGTSFLLIVMVVSIIIFSFLKWDNILIRTVTRLALLPVVAGVSYEIIKLAGRYDNFLTRILSYPGLLLQKITTNEPDEKQLEVAIASMKAVIPENKEEDKW